MIKILFHFKNRKSISKITFLLVTMILIYGCDQDDGIETTPPNILITPVSIEELSSFIAFGQDLTPSQKNPAIEYFTDQADTWVRSVSDGIVQDIRSNPNLDDYEVWIKTSVSSQWLLIYDHILDVEVEIGDQINAGEIIGIVGIGNRTELQINDPNNIAHCPLQFGSENFIQQHTSFSDDWCLEETVVP